MNPVLKALTLLGGSGTNGEIYEKVIEILEIPREELDIPHNEGKAGLTEVEYRLMWTRNYLKNFGLIDNSIRGVWAFTEKGMKTKSVDQKEVVRFVRALSSKNNRESGKKTTQIQRIMDWQEELLDTIQNIKPQAFEKLIQRLLREEGFIHVDVTGKSGDGGIDGHGIMKIGDLLGFQVVFQAKRWKGSVGPGQVRDFRGAMVGRADKGILITTGTFTRDAVNEAKRDGAPAIDLIDGDQLAEMLKKLSLGVTTKLIEDVIIDHGWFNDL
jgi:restriction system protein